MTIFVKHYPLIESNLSSPPTPQKNFSKLIIVIFLQFGLERTQIQSFTKIRVGQKKFCYARAGIAE